jgi:hypothetical protein
MLGTRGRCPVLGTYEGIRTEAAPANLAGRGGAALAQAQGVQSHDAVADCLSATTTLWLPVYAAGAAVLVGLGAWFVDRVRARNEVAVGQPAEDLLVKAEQIYKRRQDGPTAASSVLRR